MIQVFTKTFGWAAIHEKVRPCVGSELLGCLDAELDGCGMLTEILIEWMDNVSFSKECLARGWTVTNPISPGRWFEGGLSLGCGRLCGTGCLWEAGQDISLSNDIDSTVANRFKQNLAVGPSQVVERHALALCAMEEMLYGSILCMISPLQTTDDANRYGALGDFFFMIVQSDQYDQKRHYDSGR